MSSKITTEKYDGIRLEKFKHHLELYAEKGKARFFEIEIDGLKVVDKTDDVNNFDDYKMYMDDKTKMVKILLYSSCETSPRNDKFIFSVQSGEEKNTLGEVDVQNKINLAIHSERERMKVESLEKELAIANEELEDANEYIEKLQEQIETIQQQKTDDSKQIKLGMVASVAIEELIKRNPNMISNIPILGSLSGVLIDDKKQIGQEAEYNSHASFTSKEETTQESLAKQVAVHLNTCFTTKELPIVFDILKKFAEDKSLLNVTQELITNPPANN
jgi:hypothetical protein